MPSSDLQSLIRIQSKYAFNSEKYLRDVLNFRCVEWQSRACNDYDTVGHCAWSTGSGVGKTALLARLGIHFLHTRPYPVVPCTAPTQRQLYNVLWAEFARCLNGSAMLQSLFEWQQERIYLKGHKDTWFATAITSAPPKPGDLTTESLQGYHAEHLLFLIDETSGIADQILSAADGAMSTPSARALLASNPTRNTGYFYRATNMPELQDLWRVIFVDAEKISAPYIDKSYIKRLKLIYGENSDYFRMRVRGLPPRTEYNALVSPEQVYEAHKRVCPKTSHIYFGVDVARYGDDDTVIYVRDGNTIVERVSVHGLNTIQVSAAVKLLDERYHAEEIRVDVIGIGSGVVDDLVRIYGFQKSRIKSVHVGEDANNKQEFVNKRAEILWQIRVIIDSISIPFETKLLDEELSAAHYGWDQKDKRIKMESKDDMKRNLNPRRSPNDLDALCLCCANIKTPTNIVTSEYFKIGRTNPDNIPVSQLVAQMDENGVGHRSGLDILASFADRHGYGNGAVGINRYKGLKDLGGGSSGDDGIFDSHHFDI